MSMSCLNIRVCCTKNKRLDVGWSHRRLIVTLVSVLTLSYAPLQVSCLLCLFPHCLFPLCLATVSSHTFWRARIRLPSHSYTIECQGNARAFAYLRTHTQVCPRGAKFGGCEGVFSMGAKVTDGARAQMRCLM